VEPKLVLGPELDGTAPGPAEVAAIPPDEPADPPDEPGNPLADDFGEPSKIAIVARLPRAIVTTAIQTNDGPPHPPRRRPLPTLVGRDADRIVRA
jgi:hypothetical protein